MPVVQQQASESQLPQSHAAAMLDSTDQYFELLRRIVPLPDSEMSQDTVLEYTMDYIRQLETILQEGH